MQGRRPVFMYKVTNQYLQYMYKQGVWPVFPSPLSTTWAGNWLCPACWLASLLEAIQASSELVELFLLSGHWLFTGSPCMGPHRRDRSWFTRILPNRFLSGSGLRDRVSLVRALAIGKGTRRWPSWVSMLVPEWLLPQGRQLTDCSLP